MPLPLSRTQVDKLGKRLASGAPIEAADIESLNRLLVAYSGVLTSVEEAVRPLFAGTIGARVKTRSTTIDKLRRGSQLGSMQDLAGMRLVADLDRLGQDELVRMLVELFSDERKAPRVTDRRADPRSGYRAVHIVVFPGGVPVEIQVRTRWQHEWADFFERLGDRFGRAIRYGSEPDRLPSGAIDRDLEAVAGHAFEQRVALVEFALAASDRIAEREIELAGRPDHPRRAEFEFDTENTMTFLRGRLDLMDAVVPRDPSADV